MIKVLVLHGCCQSIARVQEVMTKFCKLHKIGVQAGLEFHFIEARFDHPDGGKTWASIPLNVPQIGKISYDDEMKEAFAPALQDIDDYINENGITVLLGFSQGGNVADLYLNQYRNPAIERVVIMSGYSLIDPDRQPYQIPCLNVVSEADEVVPWTLAPTDYEPSYMIKHTKGHRMPTSKPQIRKICAFMASGVFYTQDE